ncbi:MAG: SHOCT domain-containing protein [bacterium]|nr:MAG: SHOCT domain-containing protein [bacterium]
MGWGGQGHGWWGMGWFGGIGMLLFWVVIVVLIVLVVRSMTGGGVSSSQPGARDPMDILKERYARGEISTEEFEERKGVLEGGERPGSGSS